MATPHIVYEKINNKSITYKFLAAVHAKKINRSTNLS